ncbi:hypothetical protein [Pseudomonas putida]|uniref:Uncharacterized protein n=1 Tax=Pseudomonas putida TaxID=303 RepID=A0A8I1JK66_PSEPU|nr:hypothetical protein [Pseudomonas putida]MBI6883135.1 hypothetical protein [Pseudomonas putida]
MSTDRALKAAYEKTFARGWDKVYWALDLHDTCFRATYKPYVYEWINDDVKSALLRLAAHAETHLILWSSVAQEEKPHILKFFEDAGIRISGFNSNPYEKGNSTSHFNEKFYMSVIIDDKAGFHHSEWAKIPDLVDALRVQYPPKVVEPAVPAEAAISS